MDADIPNLEPFSTDLTKPLFPPSIPKSHAAPDSSSPHLNSLTRTGLVIIASSALFGIFSDLMLRDCGWGLNVPLVLLALLAALFLVHRISGIQLLGEGRFALIPALLFASLIMWRDSPYLRALDLWLVTGFLTLAATVGRVGDLRTRGVAALALLGIHGGMRSATQAYEIVAADVSWRDLATREIRKASLVSLCHGLLLAVPLVIVFGALFVSADAKFEILVRSILNFDLTQIILHIVFCVLFAWVCAGFLRQTFLTAPPICEEAPVPLMLRFGAVETATVLGSLNLLFLVFVTFQFPYLFGGSDHLLGSGGLTASQYARRGFFELVTVAALALSLLLLWNWMIAEASKAARRLFVLFSLAMIALLYVIIASALLRMQLYMVLYGLTELRFYTTAFMGLLATLFLWFAVTVLRGRPAQFAFGALVLGSIAAIVVNVVNPDGWIADTDLRRMKAGLKCDDNYLAALSADAVPAIARSLSELPASSRDSLERKLLRKYETKTPPDWRSWNWSRSQASRIAGNAAVTK